MFYTVRDCSGVYIFTDLPVRDTMNNIWYSDTGQCIELTNEIVENWTEEMKNMVNNLTWDDEPLLTTIIFIPSIKIQTKQNETRRSFSNK